jgi:predicted ferric reductase
MCWAVVLSTRSALLERFFGGLDKFYQVHKTAGRWSFFLIAFHPLCLSAHNLPDFLAFIGGLGFLDAGESRYLWGHNAGVASLVIMAALMALTLWIKIPYHLWKITHEWLGLLLALVAAHIFLVEGDVADYPLLRVWTWGLLLMAGGAFLYIRFLYRFLGPRSPYKVSGLTREGDILSLSLSPEKQKMDFRPSQFVYLFVHKKGISPEPHPYSIACGYNLDNIIKLGIKKSGDHTRSLDKSEVGDLGTLFGPYGRFSDPFIEGKRDCVFIGAGIGITPFLGMWHVALHSEERRMAGKGGGLL